MNANEKTEETDQIHLLVCVIQYNAFLTHFISYPFEMSHSSDDEEKLINVEMFIVW